MSSVHAFFAEIQLFEGRDLKTPIFWKNCLKFPIEKKKQNRKMNENRRPRGGSW